MNTIEKRRREWESRYQSGQTGWDRGAVSPALEHWLDAGELEPCRVLVPGSGRGHEVPLLAGLGFQVTAVDVAPSAIRALREALTRNGLQARVVEADLLRWESDTGFEAVYEQTCLCALEPDEWADYAARLHRWLTPGGRVFALFMQTGRSGGPPYHCEVSDMRRVFPESHWRWRSSQPIHVPHPNGLRELGYILERRDPPQNKPQSEPGDPSFE